MQVYAKVKSSYSIKANAWKYVWLILVLFYCVYETLAVFLLNNFHLMLHFHINKHLWEDLFSHFFPFDFAFPPSLHPHLTSHRTRFFPEIKCILSCFQRSQFLFFLHNTEASQLRKASEVGSFLVINIETERWCTFSEKRCYFKYIMTFLK